jgi:hypothetical protein
VGIIGSHFWMSLSHSFPKTLQSQNALILREVNFSNSLQNAKRNFLYETFEIPSTDFSHEASLGKMFKNLFKCDWSV